MKNVLLVHILCSLSLLAHADGTKRETVEELLRLTNADAIIDSAYAQTDQVLQNMGRQLGIRPSEQAIFDRFTSRVAEQMRKEMTWEKMKEPMIQVYMKHYTEKEMQDMIAFYSTDTGRSMVQKMPAVMQDSMLVSQQLLMEFMPQVQTLSRELRQELEAERQRNPQ